MATQMRFISGRLPRVSVCYNGGFKALSSLLQRGYAAQDGGGGRNEPVVVFEARRDEPESDVFAKTHDDQFGEQFRHFPFPGNSAPAQHFLALKEKTFVSLPKITSAFDQSDVLSAPISHHRQVAALQTFTEASRKLPPTEDVLPSSLCPASLECVVQPCPELLRKHFADLFPNRDIQKGTLTIMTLTQRTETDMGEWSDETDREREELINNFISTATAICESLQQDEHWADFIDPTSGKPYLGPFTKATLFETDERYSHLGFTIDDLGCCKVIRHKIWGTHAFVGSIFCDASLDSPVLQKLIPAQCNFVESASVMPSTSDELRSQQSVATCVEKPMNADASRVNRRAKKADEVRVLKLDD